MATSSLRGERANPGRWAVRDQRPAPMTATRSVLVMDQDVLQEGSLGEEHSRAVLQAQIGLGCADNPDTTDRDWTCLEAQK